MSLEAVAGGSGQRDLIAGERSAATVEMKAWICNPSTGEAIEVQRSTSRDGVEEAIAAADAIDRAGTWRAVPEATRAELLEVVADNLDARASQIAQAEALGTGVPITVTTMFADSLGGAFRDAAARLRAGWTHRDLSEGERPVHLLRLPWGPVAILVPWNAPTGVASKKVAYALAVGAPVILKANEWAPFGCGMLADAIHEAGLPSGAFQLVHGGAETGSLLVSDPRIRAISFTGSVEVGRTIARTAAPNFTALQLELSGNNPAIVLPDADLGHTAQEICAGMLKLNGQWCEAPRKIYVPTAAQDALIEELSSRLASVTIGAHDDVTTVLGPLAHESHRDHLDGQVHRLQELGARVETIGDLPNLGGWFWAPRIVTGVDARHCVEEMFGPVVTVHTYDSVADALGSANDSPFGLAAYVFGSEIDRAMSVGDSLRYGEVKVNGTSLLDLSPDSVQSFWRCSGIGGHGDDDVFAFFCGSQIVGVDRPGLPI